MKILVIGGGGREHALISRLRRSPKVEHIWCVPGNGGISRDAECLEGKLDDVAGLALLGEELRPDLTVVGPEKPLVLGVVDKFAERWLAVVGPSRAAAQLEGSKVFAKRFMERHGIPTASVYGIFDSAVDAYSALCAVDWPVVIKADGLCGGKGVLVTSSPDEATGFISSLLEDRKLGNAGSRVLLEEGLSGEELSYIALTDGEHILPLAPARDYKRALDGGSGPNTGGMGSYSSDSLLPPALERTICETIVKPTIKGIAEEGMHYKGFLYFGLMVTETGPKVLEFNCRMGDPEAQVLVVRMDFDLAEALLAAAQGTIGSVKVKWKSGTSVCVVVCAEGYPGEPKTGKLIRGLPEAEAMTGVEVFHAGTKRMDSEYYVSGGRVLGVTALGVSTPDARKRTYDAVSRIQFEGLRFRRDIAAGQIEAALAERGERRG